MNGHEVREDPVVHVKVPRELHEWVRLFAIRERRTIASVVVLALEAYRSAREVKS